MTQDFDIDVNSVRISPNNQVAELLWKFSHFNSKQLYLESKSRISSASFIASLNHLVGRHGNRAAVPPVLADGLKTVMRSETCDCTAGVLDMLN